MQQSHPISGNVRISGVINDQEFSATGHASGNPESGEYEVTLNYVSIPKGWHPLMYTDVKVGLLFLQQEGEARNFLNLVRGTYTSAGAIDLGDGNFLRNHTNIRMVDDRTFDAVYVMTGHTQLEELQPMEFFEETMLPFGKGKVAALAIARWQTAGEPIDGIFSTRYNFASSFELPRAQVRRVEARPTFVDNTFSCNYHASVQQMPRMTDRSGPYIGHLIA